MMPTPPPALSLPFLMARSDLTPAAKVAIVAIAEAADNTGLCTLTLAQLIAATGLPDRTLRRALHQLVEDGLLAPVRAPGRPACFAVAGGQIDRRPMRPAAKVTGGHPVEKAEPNQMRASPRPANDDDPPQTPPITTSPTLFGVVVEGGTGGTSRRRGPHRLPPDWTPDPALLAHARQHYPGLDLDRALAEFVWFWTRERPDRRADWNATFRKRLEALSKQEAFGRSAGAGAPGGARAPSPTSRPESEGMRRLRELAAKMQET